MPVPAPVTPSESASPLDTRHPAFQRYLRQLMRDLAKHKHYPAELKKRRLDGEVLVGFVVSATGHVEGLHIVRSSGSDALDQAAMATVRQASPLPTIPGALGRTALPLVVPIVYRLQVD